MSDNLKLWSQVEKTDPNHTKKVNQRGGFTAISAHYQVLTATKVFGPMGKGWGLEDEEYIFVPDTSMVIYKSTLWYILDGERHSLPFSSSIEHTTKGRSDDEFAKKVATDGLTKALSKLGFSADVFMGKFDDSKYVKMLKDEFSEKDKTPPKKTAKDKALEAIAAVKTIADLDAKVKQFEEYDTKKAGFYDDELKMHVDNKRKSLEVK